MIEVEKIEDQPDLVKDKNTGAILNVNNNALVAYKRQKKQLSKINELTDFKTEVKEDINTLKEEINSLRELILMSIENKGKQNGS